MRLHFLLSGFLAYTTSSSANERAQTSVKEGGGYKDSYGNLDIQQGMLQDYVRTEFYRNVTQAYADSLSKATVMDVGAGSGILAHFAARAGASKVYAVEASKMALIARKLLQANGHGDTVEVLHSALEDVTLPARVDALLSEPIGTLLLHERMVEAYVDARDRFLKPGGLMLPSAGEIFVAPVTNDALRHQQVASSLFWKQSDFYGYNITEAYADATMEAFQKIFLGQIPPGSLLSLDRARKHFDFRTIEKEQLREFDIPVSFKISHDAQMDGIVCWFTVEFGDSIMLSTSPDDALTHWWHAQILFYQPLSVKKDEVVTGSLHFSATERMSYNVTVEVEVQTSSSVKTILARATGSTAYSSVDTANSLQLPYISVHDYPGWTRHWSKDHQNYYYYNPVTHVSSWDPSQVQESSEQQEL